MAYTMTKASCRNPREIGKNSSVYVVYGRRLCQSIVEVFSFRNRVKTLVGVNEIFASVYRRELEVDVYVKLYVRGWVW